MKTVIMADPHIGKFWKQNNAAYNRAQKLFDYTIGALVSEADKNSNLIIAGDVYDSVHANVEMLVKFKKSLDDALSNYNSVNIISGNHEIFIDRQNRQQTLLEIGLDNKSNHIMIDGVSSSVIDNINYVFIPYQHNIMDIFMKEVPKYLSKDYMNIIIAHETPKEIFSYSKIELNPILDHYYDMGFLNIPFVILGHYHKPKEYSYKNTIVISIGCLYYNTVDDVRDAFKDNLQKRYLIIDNSDKVYNNDNYCKVLYTFGDYQLISKLYALPRVIKVEVKNQADYEKKINKVIKDNDKKIDDIILLSSKVLIDYSQLVFEGYDIYFDLIEDKNEQLLSLNENSARNSMNQINSGKTFNDRWKLYLDSLELTNEQKELANYLFDKRNDVNIDSDKLLSILMPNTNSNEKESEENEDTAKEYIITTVDGKQRSLKDLINYIDQF